MPFKKKVRHRSRKFALFILGGLIGIVLLTLLKSIPGLGNHQAEAAITDFVTRSGNKLYLNGEQFRFSGANVYWLGLDENVNGINYPTKFRTDDVLATAKEMGATVVRSHTLGVSVGCPACLEPALNMYNDAAFDAIDYAIASAKNKNIRLIIPLTDNWNYYHGGKKTFTDWRGISNQEDFYTDAQVLEDYKAYIAHILNHVNAYTGVALKDESTILAWETGNELDSATTEWTTAIADYIKSIDPKHLIADGRSLKGNPQNVSIASVDMYTDHVYPLNNNQVKADAASVIAKNKVFYVGEFDWTDKTAKQPQGTIAQDSTTAANGTRSAKIAVTQPFGQDWLIQLRQGNRTITGGVTNTVEFWAKSASVRNIRLVVQKNADPWTTYAEQTFSLTSTWQKYTMTLTPSATDTNVLISFNMGDSGSTIWVDNVSLKTPTSSNLMQNPSFEITGTAWLSPWVFEVKTATLSNNLASFLPVVEASVNGISGDLYWSLFGHNDTYGFVQHNDSYTIHYTGDTADMTNKTQLLRTHAYAMLGSTAPAPRCPNAPVLNPLTGTTNNVSVSWRGSVGAKAYTIQRLTSSSSSWQTVKTDLTDNTSPWIDTSGKLSYKYRVQGINYANVAGAYSDGTKTASCTNNSSNP